MINKHKTISSVLNSKIFSLFCSLLIFLNLTSQNLVINGNFEEYSRCPRSHNLFNSSYLDIPKSWKFSNSSTPDYFHRCSKGTNVGVPLNFAGEIEPYSGDAYIGLILRSNPKTYPYSPTYTEHICGVLSKPLEKDKEYCVSFKYAYAQNSGIISNGLGVFLSEEIVFFDENEENYEFIPQLEIEKNSLLSSNKNWQIFSGIIKAHGNERYITIGNYIPLSNSIIEENIPALTNDTRYFSYFYIDEVSIIELSLSPNCIVNTVNNQVVETKDDKIIEIEKFPVNERIILRNVLFDFDQYVLREESKSELNKIILYLENNPDLNLKIFGHTDAVGSKSFNKILSENRAKSVFEYFFTNGISINRMSFEGKGSTEPVSDNFTDYGRQLNRRVEVIFYK